MSPWSAATIAGLVGALPGFRDEVSMSVALWDALVGGCIRPHRIFSRMSAR
jgi:hypothetical protein